MTDSQLSTALAAQVQLAWVESFVAVVDYGGFSAAARGIFRSQSRISSHIADLEGWLGCILFDRGIRPVELTQAGTAFLPKARAALESLRAGQDAVAEVVGVVGGHIAVGTYPSAGASVVPRVLRQFVDAHPEVKVELLEAAVHGLDEALLSGRAALAVRPELPEPEPDISGLLLWSEPMKVVVPADHDFATSDQPVPLPALAGVPLIITGAYLHNDAEAFELLLSAGGLDPYVAFVSDQPQNLVGMVAAGLGIGFTNLLALQTVRLDGVCVVDIAEPLQRRAGVFWNSKRQLEPAAQAMRHLLTLSDLPDGTVALDPHVEVHPALPDAAP